MAINLGDAVLTFFGDTQQLDAAYDRVATEGAAKLAPASAAIEEVGADWKATGTTAAVAGEEMAVASVEASEGAQKMASSYREARGEAMLLGEATGIHLPRHVTSFLASIPGVQTALSSAFAATAVLFLVDALIKGADKLGNFIANTFIYTQAMKDSDASSARFNQQLVAIAEATKKATAELAEYGMTAEQKTVVAIQNSSKAFTDNAFQLVENQVKYAKLSEEQKGFGAHLNELTGGIVNTLHRWSNWSLGIAENTGLLVDNREAMKKLNDEISNGQQRSKELEIEMKVMNLQLRDEEDAARQQSLQKRNAFNQAVINGQQTVGTALLGLQKAQADAEVALTDTSGAKRILIGLSYQNASYQNELTGHAQKRAAQVQFENDTYRLQLANLQNLVEVEKSFGDKGIAGAAAAQVRIEELTKGHHLQLATEDAKFSAEIKAIEDKRNAELLQGWAHAFVVAGAAVREGAKTITSEMSKLEKDIYADATAIDKAFTTLGVTPLFRLKEALKVAQSAYTTFANSGIASSHDLAKAQLSVLQTQRELNVAMGDTKGLKATDQAINLAIKNLQKFEGETKKSVSVWDAFTADFKKKAKDVGTDAEVMGRVVADAAMQMQKAFESAIESAILSESSFGAAVEKATAQVLAKLAAQAAMYALYYTAQGIADAFWNPARAGADFAAAGEFAAMAAASGVAAHALAGGGISKGGSGSTGTTPSTTSSPAGTSSPQPVSTVNIQRLGSGGLVTEPTLAMLGDNPRGGSQREAVIPLGDPEAIKAIAQAFGVGSNGQNVTHNWYIKGGVMSADSLAQMTSMISRQVQTGRVRLLSSNASKLTRRA